MCSLIFIFSRNICAAIFLIMNALILVEPTLNWILKNRSSNLGETNTHWISTSFNTIQAGWKRAREFYQVLSSLGQVKQFLKRSLPHFSFLQGKQFVYMARCWALSKIAVIFLANYYIDEVFNSIISWYARGTCLEVIKLVRFYFSLLNLGTPCQKIRKRKL